MSRSRAVDVIAYTKASERMHALDQFKKSDAGVLLAPSMDRGIDLPGELCEVIIVVKMPFMATNDKQVQRRMYSKGGQIWYATQTLKSLVQMTGRGMRSEDDLCECFILDGQFLTNVWRNSRRLLPNWWVESIDFGGGWYLTPTTNVSKPVTESLLLSHPTVTLQNPHDGKIDLHFRALPVT